MQASKNKAKATYVAADKRNLKTPFSAILSNSLRAAF